MVDSPSPQPKQRKKLLLPPNPLNESSSPVPKPRQKFSRIASPAAPVIASPAALVNSDESEVKSEDDGDESDSRIASPAALNVANPKTTRGAFLQCRLFEHQVKEDGKSDESEVNSEDDGDESDESYVSAGLDHSNASRHEYLAGLSSQTDLPPPIAHTRFIEEGREPLADAIERRLREEGKQRKLLRLRLEAEAAAVIHLPNPVPAAAAAIPVAATTVPVPVPSAPVARSPKNPRLLDWLTKIPASLSMSGLCTFNSLKISDTSTSYPLSPKPKLSRMKLKRNLTTFEPLVAAAAGHVTLSPGVASTVKLPSPIAAAAGPVKLSQAVASTVEHCIPVAVAAGPVSPAFASHRYRTPSPLRLIPASPISHVATFKANMSLEPGRCAFNMAIQCDLLPPHCVPTPTSPAPRPQKFESKVDISTQTSPRSLHKYAAAQTSPRLHVSTLTVQELRSELDRYNLALLVAFGF